MGKISCEACKKSCKGQAIRLQEKYFHVKCFICRDCQKPLSAGGFYSKDGAYYCQDDYQRLFGTRCAACSLFVEGEVVSALGKTFHIDCFNCTSCKTKFAAGDKVTFTGEDYLCGTCLDCSQSDVTTPATEVGAGDDFSTSRSPSKVKTTTAPLQASTPLQCPIAIVTTDTQLSSPMSDVSDISTDKENLSNGTRPSTLNNRDLMSPLSLTSGYKSDASDDISEHKERLSPIQNLNSASRGGSRFGSDYGKFYNTSYLEKTTSSDYKKGPSINLNVGSKSHFHRPDNFSYTAVRKDFVRPMKKEDLLDNNKYVLKKAEPVPLMKNKEAIEMSRYPDAQKPADDQKPAIEKEDWPAPPATAAAYPELLRAKKKKRGRRSCATSGAETTDTEFTETEISEWEDGGGDASFGPKGDLTDFSDDEDEDGFRPIDPKIQREINYLLRHGGQGAARAFIRQLESKRSGSPNLDPISSSRTPAADHEPHYKLRYDNPMFASPSRDLEGGRTRLYSMDDQLVGTKYRSTTQTVANFPTPKPGYGLAPRASSRLSADNREAGYFSDTGFVRHSLRNARDLLEDYRDAGGDTTDGETCTTAETIDRRSFYSSQSSVEEYDPTTGLRRCHKLRSSTVSSDALSTPYMGGYKRPGEGLVKADAPPTQIYSYEQLKITNPSLPPETDPNSLERHLAKEEFESLFNMPRESFYRLAEWKRNDMKRRIQLF